MSRLAFPREAPPIQIVQERVAYSNEFVTVYDDSVLSSDGPGTYLRIVERSGEPGVACVATCGHRIALVLVYRYPIGQWEWAVPRGFGSDLDPRESLLAEMRGELGSEPTEFTELGRVTTNSGLLASEVVIYHGSWEVPNENPTDQREVHSVAWLTYEQLAAEIRDGTIRDGVTLAALTLARVRGAL